MTNHNMIPNSNPNIHAFYNDGTTRPVVAWHTSPPMALVMDEYGRLGGVGVPGGFSHVGVTDSVADRLASIDKHLDDILRHAFDPGDERVGDFNSIENQKTVEDANGNEVMQFLAAVYEKKQDKAWPAKSLINDMYPDEDDLPSRDDGRPWTAKSIGHWLRSQRDRHEGEYVLRGVKDRKGIFLWRVERRPDPGESAAGGAVRPDRPVPPDAPTVAVRPDGNGWYLVEVRCPYCDGLHAHHLGLIPGDPRAADCGDGLRGYRVTDPGERFREATRP